MTAAVGSAVVGSVAATEAAARAAEVRAADSSLAGVPGAPPAPDASPVTTWSDGCAVYSLALPTRWRLLIPTAAPAGLLPRSPQCFMGVTGAAGLIAAAAALVACGELAVACEELAAARGGLALAQPAGSISAPARRRCPSARTSRTRGVKAGATWCIRDRPFVDYHPGWRPSVFSTTPRVIRFCFFS